MSGVVRRRRFGAGALLSGGALALGTLVVAVLSAGIVVSAWWSLGLRWHGFEMPRMAYRDGEFVLDHGVLRWDMRGQKPVWGFFKDMVYWSAVRSADGAGSAWTFWPVLHVTDNGNATVGELRLLYPWAVVGLPVGLVWTRRARGWWLRSRAGKCRKCGYSRAGLGADAACPECGACVNDPAGNP